MRMGRSQIALMTLVGLAVAAIVFIPGGSGGVDLPPAEPVLVCIDSTKSTDDVRRKYMSDTELLVRRTASRQDRLLVAACGANATGEVDWPVKRRFKMTYPSEVLARQQLQHQVREVIDGRGEGEERKIGIVDLIESVSKETTPVGEMLAVAARQCEHERGGCQIYMFTDGEWADELLRIKDGITDREIARYLRSYVPRLGGLSGSTVNFVGVGLGTQVGELRLDEARSIASELIEEAGGKVGFWTTRL